LLYLNDSKNHFIKRIVKTEITGVNSCKISIPSGSFEGSVEKFNLGVLL